MTILRTTEDILSIMWATDSTESPTTTPDVHWHYLREMKIEDVSIWEEVFRQPGNAGVYGAWSPHAEFYIIVYELFLDNKETIETFYGVDASKNLRRRAAELGIELPMHEVWIDSHNTWLTPTQ
jgi:hypothetical protein